MKTNSLKMFSFFSVLILCLLCACSGNSRRAFLGISGASDYQTITPEAAYQKMKELSNFVLLDVRTTAEFEERHIAGAILIPATDLERRAATELRRKNAVILVYCRTGARASNAARILVGNGYTQVFNMGGIMNWPFETVSRN